MKWIIIILALLLAGWRAAVFLTNSSNSGALVTTNSLQAKSILPDSAERDSVVMVKPDTVPNRGLGIASGNARTVEPQQLVDFAKTQIGVPYLYGSADPAKGFDCSGFITYVFHHFGMEVPRSSIEFTNVGVDVKAAEALPGDLILFTGTDSTEHFVGHMGIVVSNADTLRFIHSTSGKKYGVTITPLTAYYQQRFVKTIRVI